jgi:hypothetical protein
VEDIPDVHGTKKINKLKQLTRSIYIWIIKATKVKNITLELMKIIV